MSKIKQTLTITVTRPTDVKVTLPAYYDKTGECSYVYHEGQIHYILDGSDKVHPLTNSLNYSLSYRDSDEEKIAYINGLARVVEATLKKPRRKTVKKKAVARKKK